MNTGKVYLIHHDFPLPTFKYSREAALYAIAAARFNKYEVVADALFARQEYWGTNGKVDEVVAGVLTPDEMKKARVLIKDPQIVQQLDHEIELGQRGQDSIPRPAFFLHITLRDHPGAGEYQLPDSEKGSRRSADEMILRRAILVLRLVLGAIFLYAAWTKLRQVVPDLRHVDRCLPVAARVGRPDGGAHPALVRTAGGDPAADWLQTPVCGRRRQRACWCSSSR